MTNDVSAATGGASIAASSGSDGAQTVAASATTVAPPAAALNLAMQGGDCLLSTGMSANDVVVAMFRITDAYRTDTGPHWRVSPFFQQFARAGLITLIAARITEATAQGVSFFDGVEPTLVVGGIVMLVAGMTSVGAA